MKSKSFGTVIVLNGPSGSGKSSIQKEFQKLMMPNLWVRVGIDNLFDNPMPEITPENMALLAITKPNSMDRKTKDASGNDVITLFVGQQGEKAIYAMHCAIAEYAKNGCNVIVDYIAYKQKWFDDLKKKLRNIKTFYIGIDIPLETLEQREVARGTSPKGHARSHYFGVHKNKKYDLRVDTSKLTAKEVAQKLESSLKT